jgi:hypothetical protein
LPIKDPRDVAVRLNLRVISQEWRWPRLNGYSEPATGRDSDIEDRVKQDLAWTATAIVRFPQPERTDPAAVAIGGNR